MMGIEEHGSGMRKARYPLYLFNCNISVLNDILWGIMLIMKEDKMRFWRPSCYFSYKNHSVKQSKTKKLKTHMETSKVLCVFHLFRERCVIHIALNKKYKKESLECIQ